MSCRISNPAGVHGAGTAWVCFTAARGGLVWEHPRPGRNLRRCAPPERSARSAQIVTIIPAVGAPPALGEAQPSSSRDCPLGAGLRRGGVVGRYIGRRAGSNGANTNAWHSGRYGETRNAAGAAKLGQALLVELPPAARSAVAFTCSKIAPAAVHD